VNDRWIGRALLVLAGVALALPEAALADRIVLQDGQTIETRGAVRLDSRRAVYTDLSGRLVALRIEEVDVARTTAPPPAAAQKAPDAPPAEKAATAKPRPPVLRLTDADVGHVAEAAQESVEGEPAPAPVVTLYSTTWCGWCRKSRQLMQALGIAFVERDVESDPRAAAEKSRFAPGSGVPVLVRGGTVVRGYDEGAIRSWAPAKQGAQGEDGARRR
jgi:glutaredoxin